MRRKILLCLIFSPPLSQKFFGYIFTFQLPMTNDNRHPETNKKEKKMMFVLER